MICIARSLFNLPMTGNLWALLVAMPLYSAAHLILGFAFSALAQSQLQAIQGAVFFYLPSMLLSGFMFPFLGMPGMGPRYRGNAATHAFCAGDARSAPERRRRFTRSAARWGPWQCSRWSPRRSRSRPTGAVSIETAPPEVCHQTEI